MSVIGRVIDGEVAALGTFQLRIDQSLGRGDAAREGRRGSPQPAGGSEVALPPEAKWHWSGRERRRDIRTAGRRAEMRGRAPRTGDEDVQIYLFDTEAL
jgi:hypothetical protein